MENNFFQKTKDMFAKHLDYDEIENLRVLDVTTGQILNIDYNLVLFDSDMNFYKKDERGNWMVVNNPNFKAIVAKQEQYKNPE